MNYIYLRFTLLRLVHSNSVSLVTIFFVDFFFISVTKYLTKELKEGSLSLNPWFKGFCQSYYGKCGWGKQFTRYRTRLIKRIRHLQGNIPSDLSHTGMSHFSKGRSKTFQNSAKIQGKFSKAFDVGPISYSNTTMFCLINRSWNFKILCHQSLTASCVYTLDILY